MDARDITRRDEKKNAQHEIRCRRIERARAQANDGNGNRSDDDDGEYFR